jgi:hypothetical protein
MPHQECTPRSGGAATIPQWFSAMALKKLRAVALPGTAGFARRRHSTRTSGRRHDQAGDGGPQVRLRRIPEFGNQRMPLERPLNDAALHARAAAMDQPHFAKSGGVSGGDVFVNDGRDIARREGVQIERGFDRNVMGHAQDAIADQDGAL